MSAPAATATATPQEPPEADDVEEPERTAEEREAYEYWGYLFKPDKTGTEKLKSLLRGLKDVMNEHYEASDNPDLTPNQLAHFYRELHGNYDQLFLGTPSESIAFIYKSLGCLHSLQPQSFSHSTAFTDPTVPALKTEGWTMWQTIQLLLGPDEHAGFLTEAVQRWDVRDPVTGELFPKVLPRECFPLEPDKHMVAWYEGVSERLRREAEDEGSRPDHRDSEAEQAEVRRLHDRVKRDVMDDEGSVDSKGPAMAYFRNPLYRHVDGRPGILRSNSKRPPLSPRPTMMDKGKGAAFTMGHVIRNIGSPHLWDPRHKNSSKSRERDQDRRRRSLPDHSRHPHHYPGDPPPSAGGPEAGGLSPNDRRHRRRPSSQIDRPGTASADDEYQGDEASPVYSPRPSPHHRHHTQHHSGDSSLRHSRSHEPTPSQKDYGGDYFTGYDDPPQSRRNSTQAATTPPSGSGGNGASNAGGGFGPSASPLFATHLARQPQPPPPPHPPPEMRVPADDPYAPRKAPSVRRVQDRPYSRSPADSDRRPDRRYESPRRPRFDQSPAGFEYDDAPPEPRPGSGRPLSRSTDKPAAAGPYPPAPPGAMAPPDARRRQGRMSGSEVSASSGAEDGRRQGRPKVARFANAPVSGVAGRRYPNESPWR
ncbi:hypothetical protein LTR36_006106 [Oleoguttula mirabilis]|uniref:DUF7514 domain-containing protein n=1 Tax=Oleoguttula mirabilis TaxID=1507867 RepID=A0AAV9JD53_9PEZI|nr:hypothetical protein LTR36_006106 [Oleoguttula mirabilis]